MYILSVFLPLLSSLTTGLFGRKIGHSGACVTSTILIFTSMFVSLILCYEVLFCQSPVHLEVTNWIGSELLYVNFAFHFDQVSTIMVMVVSIISSLVHLYSVWYIISDPHVQRFLSYLSAFTFFIILLVSADSFLLMFVGWEYIGVLSFLLINFWTTRIQASKAAIQAITVNRIGDMFLSIGFFVCLWAFSNLDYITPFSLSPYINTTVLTIIGILFLLAASGKSAQIGLHVWLVNAMEGPTPVSSMLHAATLVTAGIYLLIRVSPVLEYAPSSLICIIWVGAITSLFAASIGLLQNDIKKVIAYSTISQIGYLVLAIGLSQYNTSLLHLAGHAYFKALLFLCAGGVIHAIADQQDMRKLGGLILFLPSTYTAIFVASLSLIAIFPLSGFYSKDLILELASGSYSFSSFSGYVLGTITAGLTAFYSIRLVSLVFLGASNSSKKLIEQVHESNYLVQIPFICLTLFSIFFGYFLRDFVSGLGSDGIIASTFNLNTQGVIIQAEFQEQVLKLMPTVVTILGASLSLYVYNISSGKNFIVSVQDKGVNRNIYSFLYRRFQVDVLYGKLIIFGLKTGLVFSQTLDRGALEIIGPEGVTNTFYNVSHSLTRLDTGRITTYGTYMLLAYLSLIYLCLLPIPLLNYLINNAILLA